MPCRNSSPADIRRSSADRNSVSGWRITKLLRACENSRPIAAPTCATSLARPRRSSRAMSEACKLAGTAMVVGGIAAAVCRASPSFPASRTAFVISSTNKGMPSVRSTMSCLILAGEQLVANYAVDHRNDFAISQPIDRQGGDVGSSDPGWLELRPERHDEKYRKGCYPIQRCGRTLPNSKDRPNAHPRRSSVPGLSVSALLTEK